jgi:hypothetical protein
MWILEDVLGLPPGPKGSDDDLTEAPDQPDTPTVTQPTADTVKPEAVTPLVPLPAQSGTAPSAIEQPLIQFLTPKQDRN